MLVGTSPLNPYRLSRHVMEDPVRSIWSSRDRSLSLLKSDLSQENHFLEELFFLVDDLLRGFPPVGHSAIGTIAALLLLKARRFALASYDMALCCMGQEAGAMIRLLQEAWELLIYFRQDPGRVQNVFTNTLPTAGGVAKTIDAQFKHLREYFNEHASHLSLSAPAIHHLVNWRDLELNLDYEPSSRVLGTNIAVLFSLLFIAATEACQILADLDPTAADPFVARMEEIRERSYPTFSQYGKRLPS